MSGFSGNPPRKPNPKEKTCDVNEKLSLSRTSSSNSTECVGICSCMSEMPSNEPNYLIPNSSLEESLKYGKEITREKTENIKLPSYISEKTEAKTEANHCQNRIFLSNDNSEQTKISERNQTPSVNPIRFDDSRIATGTRISRADVDEALKFQYKVLCMRSKYHHQMNDIHCQDLSQTETAAEMSTCNLFASYPTETEISTSDPSANFPIETSACNPFANYSTETVNQGHSRTPVGLEMSVEVVDIDNLDNCSLDSNWTETSNDEAELQSIDRNSSWWELEVAVFILSDKIAKILVDLDRLLKDMDRGYSWQRLTRKGEFSCHRDADRCDFIVDYWLALAVSEQLKDFKIRGEILEYWLFKANLLASSAAFQSELTDIMFGWRAMICTAFNNDAMTQFANILEFIPVELRTNSDVDYVFELYDRISLIVMSLWSVVKHIGRMQEIIFSKTMQS